QLALARLKNQQQQQQHHTTMCSGASGSTTLRTAKEHLQRVLLAAPSLCSQGHTTRNYVISLFSV
ncbi:hypothetical protein LPJ73_001307, partial [Coemansia sp. RSA 2703]